MMPSSEARIQNTEYRIQNIEHRISVICHLSSVICLFLIIGLLAGCAPKVGKLEDGVRFSDRGQVEIESIDVERVKDGDVITIKASRALSYTAFKLAAPLRLIIDISNIAPSMYKEPMEIEDGIIKRVNTDLYKEKSGDIGRIEVEIEEGVEYELEPKGDTLAVRFKKEKEKEELKVVLATVDNTTLAPSLSDISNEEKKEVKILKVDKRESDIEEGQTPPVKVAVTETIKEKAGKLLSIDINQWKDGYIEALLRGDGDIENYDTFGLDDPERVVMDLWDIESAMSEDVLSLEGPDIEMVRIGSHTDKTRVVFDMRGEQTFSYSVDKRDDALLIAFSREGKQTIGREEIIGGVREDLSPIAPQGLPQVAQQVSTQIKLTEEERIEINGVDFKDNDISSKLIITASDKLQYDLAKSFDGKTMALILQGVFLPDSLQRTLDTSELHSPVALVSSYTSGSEDDERVMVVVRLKEESTYKVAQEGNILSIDFPKVGGEEVAERTEDTTVPPTVKVAQTEIIKEAVAPPAEEVVKIAEEVKLPPEPEKVVIAAKESKPAETEVAETEVIKKAIAPPAEKVAESAEEVKLSPEPEQVVIAAKEPEPAKKEVKLSPEPEKVEKVAVVAEVSKPVKGKEKKKKITTTPKKKVIKKAATRPKKIKKAAKRPKRRVSKKKKVAAAPELVATEKQYTGRRISLDFKDADIKNILRLIAEVSKLNIVAGEDVSGKVTLRLVNVPWDQALEIVLKTKDLGMVRDGNVIRIAPQQKIARERDQLLAEKKAEERLEDLMVRLIPVNYATAGGLQDKVKSLLSERGSVSVDSRTNILIVKDVKDNIEEANALVKKLDSPTPQVLIEARIVEANSDFARDLGIEWGVDTATIANNVQMDIFGSGGTAPALSPPSGQGGISNFLVSLPASGSAGTIGGIGFTFGKLGGDLLALDLRLSAGEASLLSKTISRPRIVTLDNKEAKISQGSSIPYRTVSDGATQTQFFDATLDLTVTPHITPDGSVMMKIKASKNSKGGDTPDAGPIILKKEVSTEILLKDGDTTVIGGIVERTESDSGSGVPFLKDVPVLGWLFKRKSVSDNKTELLIFITPTILNGKDNN